MKRVNISDLKAQLSAHLQLVKNGEEVLVCDRNRPVARIVPCRVADYSAQVQRLVVRGALRLPLKKRGPMDLWPNPPGKISDEVMKKVLDEEREGR